MGENESLTCLLLHDFVEENKQFIASLDKQLLV